MRKIIYHIATTVDGFIAHENGSLEGLLMEGDHVPDFLESIKNDYDATIMGKNTYEFGFKFGAKPGEPSFSQFGLKNYIFAENASYPAHPDIEYIAEKQAVYVKNLKETQGKDIWLMGGATLAHFLLQEKLIDELILKVNPVIFTNGLSLFKGNDIEVKLKNLRVKSYPNDAALLHYDIDYASM